MGFDWRAFAEGFAETAAANIKEKSKEARQYRLDQEQLAKDNIMKISRRNSVVNEVLGLTSYLVDLKLYKTCLLKLKQQLRLMVVGNLVILK